MEEIREIVEKVLQYSQDHLVVIPFIAVVAGFAAVKSVAVLKKSNPALTIVIGLLGTFIGLFGVFYLGIDKIINHIPEFRFFFDLLAAYIGSFMVASIANFIKPH